MDVLQDKTTDDLVKSMLAEVAKARNEINCARRDLVKVKAKARNEINCARQDLEKIQNRLNFTLVIINELINRQGD